MLSRFFKPKHKKSKTWDRALACLMEHKEDPAYIPLPHNLYTIYEEQEDTPKSSSKTKQIRK